MYVGMLEQMYACNQHLKFASCCCSYTHTQTHMSLHTYTAKKVWHTCTHM